MSVIRQGSKQSNSSQQPHPPLNQPLNIAKRPLPPITPIESLDEEVENPNQITENQSNISNSQKPNLVKPGRAPEDAWLDNLPPVDRPDEELHQQLLEKRHAERKQKVINICQTELNGILNYTFGCIDLKHSEKTKTASKPSSVQEKFENDRKLRILRANFRNGDLSPEFVPETHDPELISTALLPLHSLAVKQYLHFKSDSYLSDLSCAFNVNLSESNIEDPNPFFNKFIGQLHKISETFTSPYHPYDKLQFPFIVCVGGLNGGGRTTVTQFLQKAFDVHVIDVQPSNLDISSPSGKRNKKQSSQQVGENQSQTSQRTPHFPLKDSITVQYQDEKSASSQIASFIKSNFDGRGFIIDGYPNTKSQFASLEKELVSAGINMKEQQSKLRVMQIPQHTKGQNTSIDGLIIAINNEENRQRLIDPETGNVYNRNYYMPDLCDLIDVNPTSFQKAKEEIENRLVEITVPEIEILSPKQLQAFAQFESIAKKTSTTLTIKHCGTLNELLELLDGFISNLFIKLPNLLPHKNSTSNSIIQEHPLPPLMTLMKPTWLILPFKCYDSVSTWFNCLESFGRTIADQSNLVQTLDTKLDVLTKAALERYQLLIGQKDDRLKICNDYIEKGDTSNLPSLFRMIWDLSLKVRDHNLKFVDEIVCKSGLIELLIELRKTLRLVFIALVQRTLYVKWFYEMFHHLIPLDLKKKRNQFSMDNADDNLNEENQCNPDNENNGQNENVENENGENENVENENSQNENVENENGENDQNENGQNENDENNADAVESLSENISFFEHFTSKVTQIPFYQLLKKVEFKEIERHKETTVPPIDIQSISTDEEPQTARPIRPPDSSSDHRRIRQTRNIPGTSRQPLKEQKENKEEKHDFAYLMKTLNYYLYDNEEIEYKFDSETACKELSIEPIQNLSFDDQSNQYATEFFDFIEQQMKGNELIENESETAKKIFTRFIHLCQRKEETIVKSVIDLRDKLREYTRCKCTYEMEHFARQFRLIKQMKNNEDEMNNRRDEVQKSKSRRYSFLSQNDRNCKENCNEMKRLVSNLDGPLFKFDVDHVNQHIRDLIELELTFNTPIIVQNLISDDFLMKIINTFINENVETISVNEFIDILNRSECNFDNDEINKIEIVVRVVENIECFNIEEFVLRLVHTRESESHIMELFKRKKKEIEIEEINQEIDNNSEHNIDESTQ